MADEKTSGNAVRILPWTLPLALVLLAVGHFLPDWVNEAGAALVVLCIAGVVVIALWYRHTHKSKPSMPQGER